ncbi:GIY-YIG nuclease family protein [Polymorphospora lycopeni]|uniref:GIY-YIG nuclease family protein n=1 Tax=Polymorphospora lycopeni TaxID=3140240 RepID=A0ABV5CKU0_9ACTN
MTQLDDAPAHYPFLNLGPADLGTGNNLPRFRNPERLHQEGHIYVLRFGDTTKVGYTKAVQERLTKHIRTFSTCGPLNRLWVSGPHSKPEANEQALLAFCRARGQQLPQSREAFAGLDVDEVIRFAEALQFDRYDADVHQPWLARWVADQRAYTERTGIGLSLEDFMSDDFVLIRRDVWEQTRAEAAESIGRLFGRTGDGRQIPPQRPCDIEDELIEQVARLTKQSVADVLDLSYIDLLQLIGEQRMQVEAAELRLYAINEGRDDIRFPLWLTRTEAPK